MRRSSSAPMKTRPQGFFPFSTCNIRRLQLNRATGTIPIRLPGLVTRLTFYTAGYLAPFISPGLRSWDFTLRRFSTRLGRPRLSAPHARLPFVSGSVLAPMTPVSSASGPYSRFGGSRHGSAAFARRPALVPSLSFMPPEDHTTANLRHSLCRKPLRDFIGPPPIRLSP